MQEQDNNSAPMIFKRFLLQRVSASAALAFIHFYLFLAVQSPAQSQFADKYILSSLWSGAFTFFAAIGLGLLERSKLIPEKVFYFSLRACLIVCCLIWVILPVVGVTHYNETYGDSFFRSFYPGLTSTFLTFVFFAFPLLVADGMAINSFILLLLLWAIWALVRSRYSMAWLSFIWPLKIALIFFEICLHSPLFGFILTLLDIPTLWFLEDGSGLVNLVDSVLNGVLHFIALALSTWAGIEFFQHRQRREKGLLEVS